MEVKCRVCGHISTGYSYRAACEKHREHFIPSHKGWFAAYGMDCLPERIAQ